MFKTLAPDIDSDTIGFSVIPPAIVPQATRDADTNYTFNQNYNKILDRDWLSPARFEHL